MLGAVKPKGAAPVAAALSDAAKTAQGANTKLDVVLIADGGDSCDADVCATAASLKQKSQGLRIHVIGLDDKDASLKPLACVAAATGGTFVAATNQNEFKQALASVLDAASGSGADEPAVAGGASDQAAENDGGDEAAPNAAPAATPNADDAPVPSRVRTVTIPPPVIEPQSARAERIAAQKTDASSRDRPRAKRRDRGEQIGTGSGPIARACQARGSAQAPCPGTQAPGPRHLQGARHRAGTEARIQGWSGASMPRRFLPTAHAS